jgi:hypothetical protein
MPNIQNAAFKIIMSKTFTPKKRRPEYRLFILWAETESNRRHKDFQSFALPTELSALQKIEAQKYKFYRLSQKKFNL